MHLLINLARSSELGRPHGEGGDGQQQSLRAFLVGGEQVLLRTVGRAADNGPSYQRIT